MGNFNREIEQSLDDPDVGWEDQPQWMREEPGYEGKHPWWKSYMEKRNNTPYRSQSGSRYKDEGAMEGVDLYMDIIPLLEEAASKWEGGIPWDNHPMNLREIEQHYPGLVEQIYKKHWAIY